MDETKETEKLSVQDLALLTSARNAIQRAEAVHQFAADHLQAVYQLGRFDEVLLDGTIVRKETPTQ